MSSSHIAKKISIILLLFLLTVPPANSQDSEHVKAQLISEVRSIQPGQSFCVALRLEMDEHWHTYWKNPGDSGLPTSIEWHLPEGFVAGDIQWPYPKMFDMPQIVNFGYDGEVFLLTEIKAPAMLKSGSVVKLLASVDWLVCKESCIPGHADLMIDLPVKNKDPEIDMHWAEQFTKTRKNLPKALADWKINASSQENKIIILVIPPSWFKSESMGIAFFPEQRGLIDYTKSQKLLRSKVGYIVESKLSSLAQKLPARLKGVLYSQEGWNRSRQEPALFFDVPLHRSALLPNIQGGI